MNVEQAAWIGQQALFTTLALAAPPLIAALVVGTLVSLVQTVTQLQEITLTFIPKMAAVVAVLTLMSGWMLKTATTFGQVMFESIAAEANP